MTYLALGDSISIDTYTERAGGGAASQLAKLLECDEFINLTRDGHVSAGVVEELRAWDVLEGNPEIDVVTLTIGGNDLLSGAFDRPVGEPGTNSIELDELTKNLSEIGKRLAELECIVVMNTIYDPTEGDDRRAEEMGLPAAAARGSLNAANEAIRETAARHQFLLCDLEALFKGHGFWSTNPWLVMFIEPNLLGATQIARAWHQVIKKR